MRFVEKSRRDDEDNFDGPSLVQVDTGWMTLLEPDLFGQRRRFRAWIFTAVLSRHRFVYPIFRETTETAIQACEAAWEFFGGIFHAIIVDNTKAIVEKADPLKPKIVQGFLEYAQKRDFAIDTTRVRTPTDKPRVERTVQTVRDDCFAGERLLTIDDAGVRARGWCLDEYGMRPALDADMVDVYRLADLVRLDTRLEPPPAQVIPLARSRA